jgi:hypothetical protein
VHSRESVSGGEEHIAVESSAGAVRPEMQSSATADCWMKGEATVSMFAPPAAAPAKQWYQL